MVPFLAVAKGDTMKKVGIGVAVVAVAGISYYAYDQYLKRQKEREAAAKYGNGTPEGKAVEYAGMLYAGLHSGMFGWTEDEEALYATAMNIYKSKVSMSLVTQQYLNLYSESVINKLNAKLSVDELYRFNNCLYGRYNTLNEAVKDRNPQSTSTKTPGTSIVTTKPVTAVDAIMMTNPILSPIYNWFTK